MWTSLLGWVGLIIMACAAIPQLRNVNKVSKTTYSMLLFGQTCYLVRAIAIHEPVWIAGNILGLVSIFLVWRRLP